MTEIVKENGVFWLEITPDPTVELWYIETPTGTARTFQPKNNRVKLGTDLPEDFEIVLRPADVTMRAPQTYEWPPPVDPPPPPPGAGPFGCAWNGNSLGNLELGKYPGRAVSIRFRANHSGPLKSLRFYDKHNDSSGGYADGDGGQIHVDLCKDAGGFPGQAIGEGTLPNAKGSFHPEFDIDGATVEGEVYHLVFTNIATDPINNFVSINDMYASPASSPRQPAVSDDDLAIVWRFRTGNGWEVNDKHTPIFTVTWEDGHEQGQGYSDFRSNSALKTLGTITETLKPSSDRSFSRVHVRVRKQGSGDASLTVKLAGKTVSIPVTSTSYVWVSAPLDVDLDGGTTYPLEVSGAGGTVQIYPYRKGSADGYLNPFPEGQGPNGSEDWPVYLT